ncbi:hypothetical protein ABQX22_14255 [Xanthomonas sp. WHRI 1810A]|uniref:hypothetical protein n=1 Tax=Xanthomonas sp. WHRI 1810A TaxID=3161565 RepID=UPI0032E90766
MSLQDQEMQNRQHPVAEDFQLQRKVWRFQRVGWYVLLGVVVLTLLGVFSRGPLSSLTAVSTQGDLTVDYERFHRGGGANSMVIHTTGLPGTPVTLLISKAMLEGFSIESIQPQPLRSMGTPDGLSLTVPADKQGRATLYLSWRSSGIGLFNSDISRVGGGHVPITQFIYP